MILLIQRTFFISALLALPLSSAKALDWNETINGELSGIGAAPTAITFTDGYNIIEGTMGNLGGLGVVDADIWTFTIAAGYYLTGINLVSYSAPIGSPTMNSFMAIDDAATINTSDPSQHLSNGLWTEEFDGLGNTFTNLMAILDAGPAYGGTGFTGNLGSGTYTFWVQEVTAEIQYCIEFVVTPVPEPGSVVLLGLAGLLGLRRRRC